MNNPFITMATVIAAAMIAASCGNTQKSTSQSEVLTPVGPTFSADSAYSYCQQQCDFGPRTMNSTAHEQCRQWIVDKFRAFGLTVTEQQTTLKGYDGTPLKCTNIIASYRPELTDRILICAHWDARPWADNDPNPDNHHLPVMAANDGASGVAVMLELARLLGAGHEATTDTAATSHPQALSPQLGVDFICFDAEDWGTPQWDDRGDDSDTWALGAQYWAANPHKEGYTARYGILLDMVGGQGARFYREGFSKRYANSIVRRIWKAAQVVGFGTFFPEADGGWITDDHVPVNEVAGIPCADIVPYYPDCDASSFGPTWHTIADDMQHIDRTTLQAVGQTVVQVLFSEK